MNVYDFDGTIYSGDSTLDFYIFELRRNKKIIRALPIQVKVFIQYLLGFQTKTKWKEKFFSFLLYIDDIDLEIENFWKEHEWKIEPWYKKQKEKTDIIISASPEFLLIPLQKRLGIEVILASMVDKYTGKYNGLNCYGEEKVKRLRNYLGRCEEESVNIAEFYTDSYSDIPLVRCSKKSFLVKKKKIIEWKS